MRKTWNVNYYCRSQKAKNGTAPVELVVTLNGDRKVMNLPQRFNPEDFKRLRVSPRKNAVNTYLADVTSDIDWIHTQFPSYSPARILEAYNAGVRPNAHNVVTVKQLAYRFLADVIGHRPSLCRYTATYKKFWERYGHWLVEDVRGSEIKAYIEGLRQDGYKDSTLFNEFKRLKALFQYAFDLRIIEHHPFAGLQIKFAESKNQVFLTLEELERIRDVELPEPYLQRARDCFYFMCTSGLEWIDTKNLEPGDVQDRDGVKVIIKNRQKTGVQFVAVLVGDAYKVWERWEGRLPVISCQKMNVYVREVAKRAGIDKHLSTLSARHTYATCLLSGAYGKMISTDVLRRCLGHSKLDMSLHYARLLDESVVNAFK